jgi:O-antigen ligase
MNTHSVFQQKCNNLAHYLAVGLACFIPISTSGTNIILSLLVLFWFLGGAIQEKVRIIFSNPVTKMILWFFGLYLIGSLYSVGPLEDRMALLSKMGKLLYIPFLLPLFGQQKWRTAAYGGFIGVMLFTFVLALCKYYQCIPLPLGLRHTDACVFKDHIDTNLLMAFEIFLLVHYAFSNAVSAIWMRCGLLALTTMLIYYVGFMSEGRSGQVVFVALIFTFCIQRFRLKGVLYGFLILSMIGSLVWWNSATFQKRWIPQDKTQIEWTPDVSISQRREFFKHSLMLANQHPWFGFGTGSFKSVYGAHVAEYQLEKRDNPHGEYLNIYFQLGLMGIAGIILLFGLLFKTSFQLPKPDRFIAQGLLVAIGVGCLGNSWLMDFTAGHFFVVFTALCFGAWQKIIGSS